MRQNENMDRSEILNTSIWYNDKITINREPLFWKSWFDKGLRNIKDLINRDGTFITNENLKQEYNIKCNFFDFTPAKNVHSPGMKEQNTAQH